MKKLNPCAVCAGREIRVLNQAVSTYFCSKNLLFSCGVNVCSFDYYPIEFTT